MDTKRIVGTLLSSALVLGVVGIPILQKVFSIEGGGLIEASPITPHQDSDGDLLPDAIEWILMTDPLNPDTDGDGQDDFLEAVQHILELGPQHKRPLDHEMRVLATTEQTGNGTADVWLTMLFRFVGAKVQDLTQFEPYLDWYGTRHPLSNIIGSQSVYFKTMSHPTEGLYIILSAKLASRSSLKRFLPCTLGAKATIAGKTISSGAYLLETGGETTTLVPVSADEFVVQTLAPEDDTPFWNADRVCLYKLSEIAKTPNGSFCEIDKATCTPKGKLRCPPTCKTSLGKVTYFPDGISTVTGG